MTVSRHIQKVLCTLVLCVTALLMPSVVAAQTASFVDCPKVALVLSGGGARGFAHVGVIKVLEELGVQVDIVTGTSMGAMVGGGYASGYSVQEMQEIILGVDWTEMFAMRANRSHLNRLRRQDDYKNLGSFELGLKDDTIAMPDAVVPSQHLSSFLRRITDHVRSVNDLSRLSIPFAAAATDLSDGSLVVMQKDVNLAMAMRASMSVPGAFSPIPYKDHLLIDGGLAQNLPVEIAKSMGADIIIAVDASTPLVKTTKVNSLAAVAGQMIAILTDRNLVESKEKLGPKDYLLTVDLGELGSGDFDKAADIIAAGEASARKHIKALKRFATKRADFNAWRMAKEAAVRTPHEVDIAEVRVEGLKQVNPEYVKDNLAIEAPSYVSVSELNSASDRLWASDYFSVVTFSFEPGPNGTEVLVIKPQEKPWGYNTIRVGGKVSSDFDQEHTFDFLMAHTMSWVNSWGGEWRNELQLGDTSYLITRFYQPLGVGSPIFIEPKLHMENQSYDRFNSDGDAMGTIKNNIYEGSVALGLEMGNDAVASIGLGYAHMETEMTVGNIPGWKDLNTQSAFTEASLRYDTLDNVNFPTSGLMFNAKARRYFHVSDAAADTEFTDYSVAAILPYDWGNDFVTIANFRAGSSTIPGRYAVGGLFNLSGAFYGRYAGSEMLSASLIGMKRTRLGGVFGMPIYVGASIETARMDTESHLTHFDDRDLGVWKRAGSVFVAADSMVGPIYLALGRTRDHDNSVYFFWGRPFKD